MVWYVMVTELLCEMKSDVKREYVQQDPDSQMTKVSSGMVWYRLVWYGMA